MDKTIKKGRIGRPVGVPKKAVNLYIMETTLKKLKKLSKKTDLTLSTIVDFAVMEYEPMQTVGAQKI